MKITEFNPKITAKRLNESVQQKFGQKLNLESFTLEQLHDARNKLRTKLSQFESTSNYNSVQNNESFQKNQMFLDVINQAITEREPLMVEFSDIEKQVLQKVEEGLIDFDSLPARLQAKAKSQQTRQIKESHTHVPHTEVQELAMKLANGEITLDQFNDELDDAQAYHVNKGKRKTQRVDLDDIDQFDDTFGSDEFHRPAFDRYTESTVLGRYGLLREGEEDKAELIMSVRDMIDKVTEWMEDTAGLQSETLLALMDSIRSQMGSEFSQRFEGIAKPTLEELYSSLEHVREQLTNCISILTGEEDIQMGSEYQDFSSDEDSPELDDFGTDAAAVGGELPAGRPQRERIEYTNRVGILLCSKKKISEDINSDAIESNITTALKSLINIANERNKPAKFKWDTFSKYLVNMGLDAMDYDTFSSLYDSDETLQSLVKNYNEKGVELNSDVSSNDQKSGVDSEPKEDLSGARQSARRHLAHGGMGDIAVSAEQAARRNLPGQENDILRAKAKAASRRGYSNY